MNICKPLLLGMSFVFVLNSLALAQSPNPCVALIPPGGLYDIVRSWSTSDIRSAIDDRLYQKQYQTHDQALADGFSLSAIVYGVPLKVGNDFSQQQRDTFNSEYRSQIKRAFSADEKRSFESLSLNKSVFAEVVRCIEHTSGATGQHSDFVAVSACAARFSAWYTPNRTGDTPPKLRGGLSVQGGTCTAWPDTVVPYGKTEISCSRNGRSALVVRLDSEAGTLSGTLPAMTPLGPEPVARPVYQMRATKAAVKTIQLGIYNWTNPNEKVNGGNYFYQDVSPDEAGIVNSVEVSCSGCGVHMWLCPDGGVCTHPGSEKINDSTMRIWMHLDSANPATLTTITLHYSAYENTCVANCDWSIQHARWEAEAAKTCPVVVRR
jgi:hypothetical protein